MKNIILISLILSVSIGCSHRAEIKLNKYEPTAEDIEIYDTVVRYINSNEISKGDKIKYVIINKNGNKITIISRTENGITTFLGID
jgi:hypothetical protein